MKTGAWIWFSIMFILGIGYIGAEIGEKINSYRIFMVAFNNERAILKEKGELEHRLRKTKVILWIFLVVFIIVSIVRIVMPNNIVITPFNVLLFCPFYSIRSKERMSFVLLEDEIIVFGKKKPLRYKDIKYIEISSRKNNTLEYRELELIDREYNETRFKVKLNMIEEVLNILENRGISTSKILTQLENRSVENIF